jgi:hypothetical protein
MGSDNLGIYIQAIQDGKPYQVGKRKRKLGFRVVPRACFVDSVSLGLAPPPSEVLHVYGFAVE